MDYQLKLIKGYTQWGNGCTYKFIILNNILLCYMYDVSLLEDVHYEDFANFWETVERYDIKYYINCMRRESSGKYHVLEYRKEMKFFKNVSRQTIVNELRCNRFDIKFDNFLTGEKE